MQKRILLVEYDTDIIDRIKGWLPQFFEVDVAGTDAAARELLGVKEYHMVITEALLPKSHGFTLCRYIREHFPRTMVMIISERLAGMNYHEESIKNGACDYLEKPLEPRRLREKMVRHLDISEDRYYYNALHQTTKLNIKTLADQLKFPPESPPPGENLDDADEDDPMFSIDIDESKPR